MTARRPVEEAVQKLRAIDPTDFETARAMAVSVLLDQAPDPVFAAYNALVARMYTEYYKRIKANK